MADEIKAGLKPIVAAVNNDAVTGGAMTDEEFDAKLEEIRNRVPKPVVAAVTRVCMMGKEFDARRKQIQIWVPEPIADAVKGAVGGAAITVCLDLLFRAGLSVFKLQKPNHTTVDQERLALFGGFQPLARFMIAGSVWEVARNFGATCGVGEGISSVMRLMGKDDLETCVVANFGSGVTLSLVIGLKGHEVLLFSSLIAFVARERFKAERKSSKVKAKYVSHDKTRDKFSCIGLGIDHHGMNFNTGFFTSNALSLLPTHRKEGGKREWFR
ncbi:putative mitochondrial import inner membrane translocase subunit TIM22 [Helianthus debilis subsp. tardiflorus]